MVAPTCLHCDSVARRTDGAEIYPRRPDLHALTFWKCDDCGAYCGSHKATGEPLGRPANAETRRARILLHNKMVDPLWKNAPDRDRRRARAQVYRFLSIEMRLTPDETHTALWDVPTCRRAWMALRGQTIASIRSLLENADA